MVISTMEPSIAHHTYMSTQLLFHLKLRAFLVEGHNPTQHDEKNAAERPHIVQFGIIRMTFGSILISRVTDDAHFLGTVRVSEKFLS